MGWFWWNWSNLDEAGLGAFLVEDVPGLGDGHDDALHSWSQHHLGEEETTEKRNEMKEKLGGDRMTHSLRKTKQLPVLTSSLYPSASALTMILPTFGISTSDTTSSAGRCLAGGTSCCCVSSFCSASCSGASPEASAPSSALEPRSVTSASSSSSWRSGDVGLLSSASGSGVCQREI